MIKEKSDRGFKMCKFGYAKISALVIGAAVLALFGACDNPFSNNLGEKVNITPPEISISSPSAGDYIKNTVKFKGRADDDRKVVRVEYAIIPDEENAAPVWNRNVKWSGGNDMHRTWEFDLETRDITDGILKISFRVFDEGSTPTVSPDMVYIVKNLPPSIKMTAPNIANPNMKAEKPYTLITGEDLRGQITDRRGIRPGYPMIKIWPSSLAAEPADDDPNWGLVSAFITGQDNAETGAYNANKWNEPVKTAVQFTLPLNKYRVVNNQAQYLTSAEGGGPLDLNTTYHFRIVSSEVFSDVRTKLPQQTPPAGEVELKGYYPALIVDDGAVPADGSVPPKENHEQPGSADQWNHGVVSLTLTSPEVRPSILLDNTDMGGHEAVEALPKPNKYINMPTSRKMAATGTGSEMFRLQALASHPDGIEYAILRWRHTGTGREGTLKWDDTLGSNAYRDTASGRAMAESGYAGEPALDGKIFRFTAKVGGDGWHQDGSSQPITGIFTGSTDPYTLEVEVYSNSGVQASQGFTVYIDSSGPEIEIREDIFRGASKVPLDTAGRNQDGGNIGEDPYVVNGNLEVFVTALDDSGVMDNTGSPAYPMVKWVLTPEIGTGYPQSGPLYAQIQGYRAAPGPDNLAFFTGIGEGLESGWVRPNPTGSPAFKVNTKGKNGAYWLYIIAMDRVYNLGFKAQKLMIMDAGDIPVLNLPGLQDENADPDGSGKLDGQGAFEALVGDDQILDTQGPLFAPGSAKKKNVLGAGDGIDLNFEDDDGIDLSGIAITIEDTNGNTKTISRSQLAGILSGAPIGGDSGKSKGWTGSLSQDKMAEILNTAPPPPSRPHPWAGQPLHDGIYHLTITITDDVTQKVAIDRSPNPAEDGDTPAAASSPTISYWFAVSVSDLELIMMQPLDNMQQMTKGAAMIYGKVISQFPVQKLWLAFEPSQIGTGEDGNPLPGLGTGGTVTMYQNSDWTGDLADVTADANGDYVYHWKLDAVNFNNVPPTYTPNERYFTVQAASSLGDIVSIRRGVLIDATPPDVTLMGFEQLLAYDHDNNINTPAIANTVNGTVSFQLSGLDDFALMSWAAGDPNHGKSPLKWWLLSGNSQYTTIEWDSPTYPKANNYTDPALSGAAGWVLEEDVSGSSYRITLDTNDAQIPDGAYYLFGMALDKAQNPSHAPIRWRGLSSAPPAGPEAEGWAYYDTGSQQCYLYANSAWTPVSAASLGLLERIIVNRDSDIPVVQWASPSGDEARTLSAAIISGSVYDDDGFAEANKGNYVKIRFPSAWNADGSVSGSDWGAWLSVPGELNGQDNITFTFNIENNIASLGAYFYADGRKHYQIMVYDEPANKNGSAVAESALKDFSFIYDNNKPKIYFANYDPDSTHVADGVHTNSYFGHPAAGRPTYQTIAQLRAGLNGWLDEPNLSALKYDWNNEGFKDLDHAATSLDPGMTASWSLPATFVSSMTTHFDALPQGPHTILVEAVDLANNTTRVQWQFFKDTQGPNVTFGNIVNRAVNHTFIPAAAASDFPTSWPSDWPYGTKWKTGGADFSDFNGKSFTEVNLASWPSEIAFMPNNDAAAKQKIINLLSAEKANYDAAISAKKLSVIAGAQDTAKITGEFADDLGYMVNSSTDTTALLYYRFDNTGGRGNLDWNTKGGTVVMHSTVTNTGDPLYARPQKKASWEIVIPANYPNDGNPLEDGKHSIDLYTVDKAGNRTEIYGLNFYVDRNDPEIALTGVSPGNTIGQRQVFSADYVGGNSGDTTTAFTISGTAQDKNLRKVSLVLVGVPGFIPAATDATGGELTGSAMSWSIPVTKGHLYQLRGGSTNDAVEYTVRVNAEDEAGNVASQDFHFYMDSHKPAIGYTNLNAGAAGTTFDGNEVKLQGVATDDNKIQDIQFNLGRWDYSQNRWEFWNGNGWVANIRPTVAAAGAASPWPSINMARYNDASGNWTIDLASTDTNDIPAALYNAITEYISGTSGPKRAVGGKYMLSLSVTDWSYSASTSGNPHTTIDHNNDAFDDSNAGNIMSSRVFYIDRSPPVITWTAPHDSQLYYRGTGAGKNEVTFTFSATDPTTIDSIIKATVKNASGTLVQAWGDSSTEKTITIGSGNQVTIPNTIITVKIPNASVPSAEGLYTLTLEIKDGAGNVAVQNETKQFFFDNTPPRLSVQDPAASDNTVTGQTLIRGGVAEANIIKRVAYKVVALDSPNLTTDAGSTGIPDFYRDNGAMGNNGWYWRDGTSTSGQLMGTKSSTSSLVLMSINDGTAAWAIDLPDSGFFDEDYNASLLGSTLVTRDKAGSNGYPTKFGSANIDNDSNSASGDDTSLSAAKDRIYKLRVYLKAEDQAGNIGYYLGTLDTSTINNAKTEFFIYPEGDRPVISKISNPDMNLPVAERLMNGRVRIYGEATDNDRVASVWFRVLNVNNANAPVVLQVPKWNTSNWTDAGDYQTAQTIASTNGWYMANGGGSKQVNWWAYINANNELDPVNGTLPVKIEVRAFDTRRQSDGSPYPNLGTPETEPPVSSGDNGNRKMGVVKSAEAYFEAGAPIFEDEQVKPGRANFDGSGAGVWNKITEAHMSGVSSYKVTVKDDTGLSEIRWNNAPAGYPANLLDVNQSQFDTSYTNNHIAARARYNPATVTTTLSVNEMSNGQTDPAVYLIWEPDNSFVGHANIVTADGGVQLTTADNKRGTLIKVSGNVNTSGGTVLKQVYDTTESKWLFEWEIIVDVNTSSLAYNGGGTYGNKAENYQLDFQARDTSIPQPLATSRSMLLPIDNVAPGGKYTGNSKSAGSTYTLQGEASDTGNVFGISRVVLWFQKNGVNYPFRKYNLDGNGLVNPASANDFASGVTMTNVKTIGGALVGGTGDVTLPMEDGKSGIWIDRNDAYNRDTHHGMGDAAVVSTANGWNFGANAARDNGSVAMGLTNAGSAATWYAEINSTRMESGPYQLNVLVIDTAGNATLFNQKLIVRNDAPEIASIRLVTDIRADASPNLQNVGLTLNNYSAKTGLLNWIRSQYNAGAYAGKTDIQKGISGEVAISYGSTAIKSVTDFNVRNKLFGVEINARAQPGSNKTRNFRLEYVAGQTPDVAPQNIKRGRVYVIQTVGGSNFGAVGAPDNFTVGTPFLATEDGAGVLEGNGTVTELNTSYYNAGTNVYNPPTGNLALADVSYTTGEQAAATKAEFFYKAAAFGTAAGTIRDAPPAAVPADALSAGVARFILKIFDGPETDDFADFALISVRVNNNDISLPKAQLHDLNPKTEGLEQGQSQAVSLTPLAIGQNRLRGGLWNTDNSAATTVKSGHIEPRRTTSFRSAQMGGAASAAAATESQPYADPVDSIDKTTRFTLERDTVSGQVVLRGYARDDQRIDAIALKFATNAEIVILETSQAAETAATATAGITTGLLQVPAALNGQVYYTDRLDLYGHEVEWAYVWDTQVNPLNTVVADNVAVQAISYNKNSAPQPSPEAAAGTTAAGTVKDYNSINVNIRPYITGFTREAAQNYHDTRSVQGWYSFSRGETVRVNGFNLQTASGATVVNLRKASDGIDQAVTAAGTFNSVTFAVPGKAAVTDTDTVNNTGDGAGTTAVKSGVIRLTANGLEASNTNGRTPNKPNPWNTEMSEVEGSDLWDDYTAAHIWQSNSTFAGTGNNANRGYFPSADNWFLENPAMSINPANGVLYSSHNETGHANYGETFVGTNNVAAYTRVARFIDPIVHSDTYYSPAAGANADQWTVFNMIGRSGTSTNWRENGGLYVAGPQGVNFNVTTTAGNGDTTANNGSGYLVEKNWYSVNQSSPTYPGTAVTDQFANPHIVTSIVGGTEHIHVSYYDSKDGSVKYRHNTRNDAGTITAATDANNSSGTWPNNNIAKAWINLDGGYDGDDDGSSGTGATDRVVNKAGRGLSNPVAPSTSYTGLNVGRHNAIDVTSDDCPVVAYFDETNQRLKLAVSNSVTPGAGNWTIRDKVLPDGDLRQSGAGHYVSIRIDRTAGLNRIHIAAFNPVSKDLVYISGLVNTGATGDAVLTGVSSRVVDNVGNVGLWCDISLDSGGNPYIAYMDESYLGAMDGVKLAFLNAGAYTKAVDDIYGDSISGWEALNIPARYRVRTPDARVSIENFPARNVAPTDGNTQFWSAAVGYLSNDRFRIAYYVKQ
jgi:hypothetical protein